MGDEAAGRAKSKRGDLYRHYLCESAREAGILIMVFSVLDFRFNENEVSTNEVWWWMLSGAILLVTGIFTAKEK